MDYSEISHTPTNVTNTSTLTDTAIDPEPSHALTTDTDPTITLPQDTTNSNLNTHIAPSGGTGADNIASIGVNNIATSGADGVATNTVDGVVTSDTAATDFDGVGNTVVDGVVVAEVEDNEFGSFVSVSTPADHKVSHGAESLEKIPVDGIIPTVDLHTTQQDISTESNTQTVREEKVEAAKEIIVEVTAPVESSKGVKELPIARGSPKLGKQNKKRSKTKQGKKLQSGSKKKKFDSQDKNIDDTQSEISYGQLDTDLSKSKVSKKVNCK